MVGRAVFTDDRIDDGTGPRIDDTIDDTIDDWADERLSLPMVSA